MDEMYRQVMDMREGMSGKLDYVSVFKYFDLWELSKKEQIYVLGSIKAIEDVVLKRRDAVTEKERTKQHRQSERKNKSSNNGRAFKTSIRRNG